MTNAITTTPNQSPVKEVVGDRIVKID